MGLLLLIRLELVSLYRWRTSGDVNDQGSMEDVLFLSKLVDQLGK